MKRIQSVLLICAILLSSSCINKSVTDTQKRNPGDSLFSKAEHNFNSGDHKKALRLYTSYLKKYSQYPLAPAAMLKTGVIYVAKGDYKTARKTYLKLISQYPSSSYISDAMVEILITYYKEGRYQDVIEKSYKIPEDLKPDDYIIRKYAIVGDAFLAMEEPVLAVDSFVSAFKQADVYERRSIAFKLRKGLSELPENELLRFIDSLDDEDIRGYFEYQRCLSAYNINANDDALRLLTSFLQQYPSHLLYTEAETLKEKLTSTDFDLFLVGCLLPTSGKYASYGNKAQMGFDLAYNDFTVNPENPVTRVIYRDTGSDSEKTREAVRELSELGVAAIIGPVGTVVEAAEEAQLRGIPIITFTGKDDIAETGDYVFRHFLSRKMQVQSIVSYSFEVLGINNFAVLYPDEKYGQDFMNIFWDEINKYNGDIVGIESYPPGSTDFAKQIRKLTGMHYKYAPDPVDEDTANDPTAEAVPEMKPVVDFDALFIPDTSSQVGLILPQLSFYDVGDIFLLGTNLWNAPELLERAPKEAESAIIPDGFFAGSSELEVQSFVTGFRNAFDEDPGFIEAVAYDSAMMIFDVMKNGNVTTPAEFRDKLFEMNDFKGVTGITGFDASGNAWKELFLLNVKNKEFVERAH